MRIELSTLKVIDRPNRLSKDDFVLNKSDIQYDYSKPIRVDSEIIGNRTLMKSVYHVKHQTLFPVHDNVLPTAKHFHNNLLEYLEYCWANHYGALITPDIIWYTLLCEVALIVSENPSKYRDLFTNSSEKEEISVYSNDLQILPLDKIIEELRHRVPAGLTNVFIDDFSTSTPRSISARSAAFADIVSPYYSYSMYCCGIPFVELGGAREDWTNLYDRMDCIVKKLQIDELDFDYYYNINYIISCIISSFTDGAKDFWEDIFYAEHCGSGSETELYGWSTRLYRKQPDGVRKACNFSTHVSNVSYKHLNTGKKYVMKQGLFYSMADNQLLVPDFALMVFEDRS